MTIRLFALAVATVLLASQVQAQSWPALSGDVPRAGDGVDDAAVIVGVSQYAFLPPVAGAADNASDWFQHLVKVRGVKADRVTLLRDSEASKERIERALKQAATNVKAGGTLWFVFIGHGAPSPSGDDGLLLGVDTQPDIDSLGARGLAQQTALSIAQGPQGNTVAIFDACFSGKTADGARPLVDGMQATLPVRRAQTHKTTTILSSSSSFAGPLPGEARPAFSYVLLGALRGWADADGDTNVSVDEALSYTQGALRATLKATDRLPTASGITRGVVLAHMAKEQGPDIDAIVLKRCPAGTRWHGRRCEAVMCPAGTEFDGRSCVATSIAVTCPAGTTWSGSACVAQGVSCPTGSSWDGKGCVATSAPRVTPAPVAAREATSSTPNFFGSSTALNGSQQDQLKQLSDAASPAKRVTVTSEEISILISEKDQPKFLTGKATLAPGPQPFLDAVAKVIQTHAATHRFVVEGHSDDVGDADKNQKLTAARAETIRAYLIKAGAPADAIDSKGWGEQMPIDSNRTAQARARNRRIEIRTIKK